MKTRKEIKIEKARNEYQKLIKKSMSSNLSLMLKTFLDIFEDARSLSRVPLSFELSENKKKTIVVTSINCF